MSGRDPEADVGALGLDPDLRRRVQAIHQLRLASAQLAPGRHRIGPVQEQRPGDELGVRVRRHPGLLGQGRSRQQRAGPAQRQQRLLERPAGGGRPGHQRRVDVGQLGGVGRRVDADERVDHADERQVDRRRLRPSGDRRRGGTDRPPVPAAQTDDRPRVALQDRPVQGEASGSARVEELTSTRSPGGPASTSRTAGRRTPRGRGARRWRVTGPPAPGSARPRARAATPGRTSRSDAVAIR